MIPEKILGVYGGLGPAASAEFMRLLAAMAPAQRDQEHPVVYLYSNAQTPDRTAAFMGKGESPENALREGLMKLCSWGVNLLAVPCNTAHIFIDHFRAELPVPLIHIVEATVDDAMASAPEGCWLIATGATLDSGIYTHEAQHRGYRFWDVPDDVRSLVSDAIRHVKAGELAKSGVVMDEIGKRLWNIQEAPIVCACTELPLAYDASSLPPHMGISSLKSLSRACLDVLYRAKQQ
ncbi:MAG: amino acid racemase [Pyramidobacter sp.]|nr:amino acid racemase [Pyramidobacter sp.]